MGVPQVDVGRHAVQGIKHVHDVAEAIDAHAGQREVGDAQQGPRPNLQPPGHAHGVADEVLVGAAAGVGHQRRQPDEHADGQHQSPAG